MRSLEHLAHLALEKPLDEVRASKATLRLCGRAETPLRHLEPTSLSHMCSFLSVPEGSQDGQGGL